ncbi:hypothetical protein [Paenibacillus marchantiophytorum]
MFVETVEHEGEPTPRFKQMYSE